MHWARTDMSKEKENRPKKDDVLDDFPNRHFASALCFANPESDMDEQETKARRTMEESMRKRREDMEQRKAEWEALPEEEKKRIEKEHEKILQENDERRWRTFLEELGDNPADERAISSINAIGERIWRKPSPRYGNIRSYGRESDDTLLCPGFLSSNIPPSLPSNGDRHDEGMALAVAKRLDGIAIGRHPRPILLWLYNTCSPYSFDGDGGSDRTYLLFSPEEIARAQKDGDTEFMGAFEYLCDTYGVIYDERRGDGYAYEAKNVVEHVEGAGRDVVRHVFRLTDKRMEDIVPDEVLFLSATLDVSFIVDRFSAFYHFRTPSRLIRRADGGFDCEYDDDDGGELPDEELERLQAPGSAYWRMYRRSGFERLLAETCLDAGDKAYLEEIMGRTEGRFRIPWSLAHSLMGFPGELKNEQLRRVEKVMQDAVIAWDYTKGSPDGMYELLDENPSDEQIYNEMNAWMRESGCHEMVLRAQPDGSIWDIMKERDSSKNAAWTFIDCSKEEDVPDEAKKPRG